MAPRLVAIQAQPEYRLRAEFENGETRVFDVSPFLDKGVFRELKDPEYFASLRLAFGGVEWPNEQDLSADTLYIRGVSEG